MTILLFFIIFTIVVVVHEFGHYLIGTLNGIHAVEFSVGMGPELFHFNKAGTKFSWKLLPLGGACSFEGLDEIPDPQNPAPVEYKEGSFPAAKVWSRIATIFAGPFFNVILGFFLAMIVVSFTGADRPVIMNIMEDSAAEDAGLTEGDEILSINGTRVHLYREVSLESSLNEDGTDMTLKIRRDGEVFTVTLTPRYSEEDARYYMGIVGGSYSDCKGLDVVKYGYYETRYVARAVVKSLSLLFRGKLGMDSLSGPVGIASMVGETYTEAKGYGVKVVILTMMNFIVLLSVNLGVMNLLPLPALDGGRLIFLIVELFRGKPVPPEKEGLVHFIGFVLLMILAVFVFYNDIQHVLHGWG
ncbi:MAG: RIP metalloprotease RseP [Lachnospiraceae bacterium]|nr:RIP metalloprotease RseP [Lachnospiraceae bacterium]